MPGKPRPRRNPLIHRRWLGYAVRAASSGRSKGADLHADSEADFASRGLTNVTSVDVDPVIQATFGVGGRAPTDPASAAFATYYGNYHGGYEPPLCHAQARALFDTLR